MVSSIKCPAPCEFMRLVDASSVEAFDVDVLSMSRRVEEFKVDQDIFSQNSEPHGLYCLRSGHVMLSHVDMSGNKTAFRVVAPGEMLGYRSLFGDDRHTASARALTACSVCFYPKKMLEDILNTTPRLTRMFLRSLARDRGPPDALLLRSHHSSVRARLVHLLLILIKDLGKSMPDGGVELRLPLRRRDIGSLVGSRPESVSRAIKELESDGVVYFRQRNVVVPDKNRLLEEADAWSSRLAND